MERLRGVGQGAFRAARIRLTIAAGLVVLCGAACGHHATFAENYDGALQNIKQGKYEAAQLQLQHAYIQNSASIETKYQLAMVKLRLLDDRSAYVLLREAESKDHNEGPFAAAIRVQLAKLFIASRMYEDAQKRLLLALEKEPDNREARAMLAATLAALAQPDAAKEQVDLLLAEDPSSLDGRVLSATLHLAARETEQAEKALQDDAALTGRSTSSLVALANFYKLVRQPKKALKPLLEVVDREPNNLAYRTDLAWIYAQAGDRPNAEKTFRELPKIAPGNLPAMMALANYYIAISDWAHAAAELEALNWKHPDPHTQGILASVYYRAGRRADARNMADQLIRANPKDAGAHLLTGLLKMEAGNYDAASTEFNQVIHFQSDSSPAYYLLARASLAVGKEALGLQQMERSLQLDKNLLAPRVWLMDYHLSRGSKDVALNLGREAPPAIASTPEMVVMMALCDPLADLTPEQQLTLQHALLERPRLMLSYEDRGMTTLLRKYGGPLRTELQAVVKAYPQYRPAQALLFTILEAQGKQGLALEQIEKQVAANPKSTADLLTLARLQIRRGDFPAARTALSRARALEPDNPEVMVRLAEAEASLGEFDESQRYLDALTKRYPNFSQGWSFKGILAGQRGDSTNARAYYQQALKLDKRNAVAANNLALLLAAPPLKKLDAALDLARNAHSLDPTKPEFSDTLGWVQYLRSQYHEALLPLTDAVRLKPEDASFHFHLGMAQSRLGRDKEALLNLETAIKLNPNMPQHEQAQEELNAVRLRLIQ